MTAKRSRMNLWKDIVLLLREFWLSNRLASFAVFLLTLLGNARSGMYLFAMGGLVDSFVNASGGGYDAFTRSWISK
jgi:hypothetical protein